LDKNSDGDFQDDNEEIAFETSPSTAFTEFTVDDLSNGMYRVRVMSYYGRVLDICSDKVWGEIIDFDIEVTDPLPCQQIIENFEYNENSDLTALDGGANWTSDWDITLSGEGQIAIVPASNATSPTDGKLGILNYPGSLSEISREMNVTLNGSKEMYISVQLERESGNGITAFDIGNLKFGVTNSNRFFLNDQLGPVFENDKIYRLLVKIAIQKNTGELVQIWINPSTSNPVEAAALSSTFEIGAQLTKYKITQNSNNNFSPLICFIDNIMIGCDDNFEMLNGHNTTKKSNLKTAMPHNLDFQITPNPGDGVNQYLVIQSKQEVIYQTKIFNTAGALVWSGKLGIGRNKLPALSAGAYVLQLSSASELLTKPFVVQ
jgi:hypothetical protein